MKISFYLAVVLLLLVAAVVAQKTVSNSPLHAMVAAERAFAKASEEKGTRESFMMFIAEDGILFRPTAVLGKKWMQEHPAPPSNKRPLLAWQPTYAEMAVAGDMGFTFGPWEYKEDIKDAKPVAFGHFATVWKKQTDGTWKFAIDLGISHPLSATPATPWEPPMVEGKKKPAKVDVSKAQADLRNSDVEFSSASASQGSVKAFAAYSAEDVRIFRNGHLPFAGTDAISVALSLNKGTCTWQPEKVDVSRSGDIGYTYGLYELRDNGRLMGKGNYMRFWKKQQGVWKMALDVADPLPLEEKKP